MVVMVVVVVVVGVVIVGADVGGRGRRPPCFDDYHYHQYYCY